MLQGNMQREGERVREREGEERVRPSKPASSCCQLSIPSLCFAFYSLTSTAEHIYHTNSPCNFFAPLLHQLVAIPPTTPYMPHLPNTHTPKLNPTKFSSSFIVASESAICVTSKALRWTDTAGNAQEGSKERERARKRERVSVAGRERDRSGE